MHRVEFSDGAVLVMDPEANTVITHYQDACWTGGGVVPEDDEHAHALGTTALHHRWIHELAHHLVAHTYGEHSCPILWATAHGEPLPANAAVREWEITVVTYAAFRRPQRHPEDWGAFIDMQRRGANPLELTKQLRRLY